MVVARERVGPEDQAGDGDHRHFVDSSAQDFHQRVVIRCEDAVLPDPDPLRVPALGHGDCLHRPHRDEHAQRQARLKQTFLVPLKERTWQP